MVPARGGGLDNAPSPGDSGGRRSPAADAAAPSLSGPLGERIFQIRVNPFDGDVWMCTSAGLARYRSFRHGTWSYYTRANGLPSDQAMGIAFDADGRVYVATQCDGIAIGVPASDGATGGRRSRDAAALSAPGVAGATPSNLPPLGGRRSSAAADITWHTVRSPYPNQPGPAAPTGTGLPCNLTNDILVAQDGTVYVATDAGLAWSTDHGDTWTYLRGKDWSDKIKQSAAGPPPGWSEDSWRALLPQRRSGTTLLEKDYITCLAQSPDGHLLLGYRRAGRYFEIAYHGSPVITTVHLNSTSSGQSAEQIQDATCIDDTQGLIAGTYSKELLVGNAPSATSEGVAPATPARPPASQERRPPSPIPPLPSGAPTPTLADLNAELAAMAKVPPDPAVDGKPLVIPLDEDWLTDGRWLGRYGRWTAILCAECAPGDYIWGAGPEPMEYSAWMGSHNDGDDGLRYWIAGLQTTASSDLEIPPVYMDSRVFFKYATPQQDRRPCFWDDHGETYPGAWEGPDIYCNLQIPAGTFVLSLESQDGKACHDLDATFRENDGGSMDEAGDFEQEPILATARNVKYGSPNYKRFLVHGPEDLTLKVARNYTFNASVWAIFLDAPGERPVPYFMSVDQWNQSKQQATQDLATELAAWKADPARRRPEFAPQPTGLAAAKLLLTKLDEMRDWNPHWWAESHRRIAVMLARWAEANIPLGASADASATKASAFYQAGDYAQWQACQTAAGERSSRDIEKSLKWDHIIMHDSGHEYEILTKYLSSAAATTRQEK